MNQFGIAMYSTSNKFIIIIIIITSNKFIIIIIITVIGRSETMFYI